MSIIKKKLLVDLNSFLIILFPFALVSGPLIPEIFLFIIVFSFIFLTLSEKKFHYFDNNFLKIFFLIFIIINISSFYNFHIISLKNSIFYFRFGLFSLAIFFFLNENSKLNLKVFISISVLILILFLDSAIQFIFDKNIIGIEKHISGRVSSFFGDELILGSFVSKFFLLYLALFYSSKFFGNKILIFTIVLVFFLIVFFSASRTSLASFILSIIFFLLLSKNYKIILRFFFVFLLSILILNQFDKTNFKRVFEHTKYQMFTEYNSFNFLSQRHILHLTTAYKIFLENKILGAGPKSFRVLCDNHRYIPHEYINKTNSVYSEANGTFNINLIAFFNDVNGVERSVNVNTENFFQIFNNYKHNLNDTKIIAPHSILQDHYNKEFSHIKTTAQLLYEDGNKKKINFFNEIYHVYLDDESFRKNQKIIKFRPLYKNGCNTHPHNFLIQILSETGLVGFLFYALVGFYLLIGIIKFLFKLKIFSHFYDYKIDIKISLIFASFLIIFFPIFPSGNFFNNWLCLVIYFPVGFLLNFIDKNKTIKT